MLKGITLRFSVTNFNLKITTKRIRHLTALIYAPNWNLLALFLTRLKRMLEKFW